MAFKSIHRQPEVFRLFPMIALAAGICLTAASPGWALSAQKSTRLGETLYKGGHFEDAVTQYQEALTKDPESPLMNYNLGTAQYKAGQYAQARVHLQKALLSEEDPLREKAYYNLGNVSFRLGLQQEAADLAQAVSSMGEAVTFYESALKMNDKDDDARYNYEIARKELERLKKKQQEQQKQKEQQQKQPQNGQEKNKDQQQKDGQQQKDEQGGKGQQSSNKEQNGKKDQSENKQDQNQPSNTSGDKNKENQQQNKSQADEGRQERPQDERNKPDQQQNDTPGSAENSTPGSQQQAGQGEAQSKKQSAYFNQEEARMLLNKYRTNEEPQMLFNAVLPPNSEAPVEKNW